MTTTSLSVLVPVYNEEYLVEESLRRLFLLDQSPYLKKIQVIVVNDCSTDGTGDILERLSRELPALNEKFQWRFMSHEKNMGKGKAVQTALKEACCDISIIHDADLEYHPKDILRMIPLFMEEGADAVYGSRFAVHEYRRVLMYRHQLGNRLITFLCNLFSNLNLTDIETCYKAVRTALLKSIPIISNDFRIEPELTLKLAKRKARIFEIPISYSGRSYLEGKKIDWRDGYKALWAIVKFGFSDNIFTADEYGSRILARLSRAERFNAWMVDKISPYIGQRILEIGSGIGNLTVKLLPRKSYCATDMNPMYLQMIEGLKTDKPYLSVSYLDLNNISGFVECGKVFDTVICLNVVEHLDDDEQAMKNIAALLEEGGRAIVLVPRGQWLYGTLDKVLGHRRRYAEEGLRHLAAKAGLEVNVILAFNRVSTIPWFVNGRIFRKRDFGFIQIMLLDFLIPIFKRIDPFIPVPSLSCIAILKK